MTGFALTFSYQSKKQVLRADVVITQRKRFFIGQINDMFEALCRRFSTVCDRQLMKQNLGIIGVKLIWGNAQISQSARSKSIVIRR